MIEIYTFPMTDQSIRAIRLDGKPWLVAKDVCQILGLNNTSQAIRSLEESEKQVVPAALINREGRPQDTIGLVDESGFYSLVFKSQKPEAKQFTKWVTSEVLPAIRQDGAYISPEITEEQKIRAKRKIEQEVYSDVRNALKACTDYGADYTPKVFIEVQDMFHQAVTGMRAKQIRSTRKIVSFSGDQPTPAEINVAKNYLDEDELAEYEYLSEIVLTKLKHRSRKERLSLWDAVGVAREAIRREYVAL